MLLTDCQHQQVARASERLRMAISGRPFETTAGALSITVSLGAASLAPGGLMPAELALSAADQALYNAKESGRDQTCCVELLHDGSVPELEALAANRRPRAAGRGVLRAVAVPDPS